MMINEFNGLWRSGYNAELRHTFDETDTVAGGGRQEESGHLHRTNDTQSAEN